MQKKTNKKKILGIMSKLGNFINKSQPIVGDIPPQQDLEENVLKEPKQIKKEEKNFNLQIEDDEKAEYDLNDDDDEEEEEEEDDDNEEKAKENQKESNEESTNDTDSSNEKKEIEKKKEEKKEELKEQKKENNIISEKNDNKKEEIKMDINKEEIKKEEKKEKLENEEDQENKKVEEKKEIKESKKEDKEEKKKEEIKNEKKIEDKKEVKKEDKKEVKNIKEDSKKKIDNNQKLKKDIKNASKPISKTHQPKKEAEQKVLPKKEENKIKEKPMILESTNKEQNKTKRKFQKKQKISDKNKICHFFLKKGSDIDIKEFDFYCIRKIKKEKTLLSKLNNFGINLNLNIKLGGINKVSNKLNSFFKKKPKDIKYTDYYLIINENFIYFCKDAEVYIDEPDKRRVGSVVPFSNIKKINVEREGELYKIIFEIHFRTLNKIKEFFVDNEIYGELLEIFHEFKKDYNLEYNIEIKEKKLNAENI